MLAVGDMKRRSSLRNFKRNVSICAEKLKDPNIQYIIVKRS